MSFVWNANDHFQSSADINTNGIQIADVYFPYTDADKEKYVSDEYVSKRIQLMKYNQFKNLEANQFHTVFSNAGNWEKTFSNETTFDSGWIPISFKSVNTYSRAYSFDFLYIPFIFETESPIFVLPEFIEIRFDATNDTSYKTYSRRVTAPSISSRFSSFTFEDKEYTIYSLGLGNPADGNLKGIPFFVDESTKIAIRFSCESYYKTTLKTCWMELYNADFAAKVFEDLTDMNLKYIEVK